MKKFIGFIFLLSFLFVQTVFAGEEAFSLWTSQTFTNGAGYSEGEVIATSAEIMNSKHDCAEIIVRYEILVPDGATAATSYEVQAVLEGNIGGNWYVMHAQSQGIRSTALAPTRMLVIVPEFNMVRQPGNTYSITVASKQVARVSVIGGRLPEKFRVKLVNRDLGGSFPLTSITVTGFGRKYDISTGEVDITAQ